MRVRKDLRDLSASFSLQMKKQRPREGRKLEQEHKEVDQHQRARSQARDLKPGLFNYRWDLVPEGSRSCS